MGLTTPKSSAYQEDITVYQKKNIFGNPGFLKCLAGLTAIGCSGTGIIVFSSHVDKEKANNVERNTDHAKERIKAICKEKISEKSNGSTECSDYLNRQNSNQS